MQFYSLFHLLLSDLRSAQYWLSREWKPANFAWNLPLCHNHSTNISPIANSNGGGEREGKDKQFMYWPCHDMIKTDILSWSQRCRNRLVGTAVRFQPGQMRTVLCPVRVTHPPGQIRSGFWLGLEPNRIEPLLKTRTAGVLPGCVANSSPTTPKPGPLQLARFYHQKPGLSTSQLQLQLRIWVLIIWWHDQCVECVELAGLSPPAFRFAIWQYWFSPNQKPANFA